MVWCGVVWCGVSWQRIFAASKSASIKNQEEEEVSAGSTSSSSCLRVHVRLLRVCVVSVSSVFVSEDDDELFTVLKPQQVWYI